MRPSPAAWGALVGLAAIAASAPWMDDALDTLRAAREAQAAAQARASASAAIVPLVPPGLAVPGASRDAAASAFAARLRGAATRAGLLVEEARGIADLAGLARVRLRLSGSEDALAGFLDAVERGPPLARMASWRVERAGAAVQLRAEVVAPWR